MGFKSPSPSLVLAMLFLFSIYGCDAGSDSEGFASLEEKAALQGESDANDLPIEIESFSPTEDPVTLSSEGMKTFAIALKRGSSPRIKYSWIIDGTVVSETNQPFFDLDSETVVSGRHELVVQIENSKFKSAHSFNLFKNTPPTLVLSEPKASFDEQIDCTSNVAKKFTVEVSDVDGDDVSLEWLVNSSENQTKAMLTFADDKKSATFLGDCDYVGEIKIEVTANDNADSTSAYWKFNLLDPTKVNILDYSPKLDPIVFKSNETKIFSVSAIGKNNLAYTWLINDVQIEGKSSSSESISAAELNVGNQVLKVVVSDGETSASKTWNVYRNAPPVLSNPLPLTTLKKMNFKNFFNFTINASDENSDPLSYVWTLNDLASAKLLSTSNATGTQAVFSPDLSLLGRHTIKVTASDGIETASYTWSVEVNRFSDYCNDLTPGQVCTIMGPIGLGSETNVSDNKIIAKPYYIADDGSGNIFFSDYQAGVVWLYNNSDSPITRIGVTVEAGQAKVVAGNGAWGNSADLVQSTDYQTYGPMGVAYNISDDQLFVAEYARHRVVRFNSSGLAQVVFGRGNGTNNLSTNTNGSVGTDHVCVQPRDIVYDQANDVMVVACGGSHAVKYATNADDADVNQILGYIAAGRLNGSNALVADNSDGAIGGSAAGANQPFGLAIDPQGNVYIASYGRCKIRVWNREGGTKTFFGAVNVALNNIATVTGTGTCNNTTNGSLYNAAIYNRPYDVELLLNAGDTDVDGFFISATNGHRIFFANNTGSDITLGNQTVSSYTVSHIIGTGAAEFGGNGTVGMSSAISTPIGLIVSQDKNTLYFADYGNNRLRSLDLSNHSGTVATVLGNGDANYGFNGDVAMAANDISLWAPTRMTVNNNILYVSDFNNYRVRQLDLATGTAMTAVGEGAGVLNEGLPSTIRFRGITALAAKDNIIVIGDNQHWNSTAVSTDRNCAIRGYNPNFTALPMFGEVIPSNWVVTLGGNYGIGCQAWDDGTYNGTAIADVSFRPEAMDFVNGKLIVVDTYYHCLYSIDENGFANREIGKCGTTAADYGNVSNVLLSLDSAKFRYPRAVRADPLYPNYDNYFIADQWDQASTFVKYVNNSPAVVTINGINVNPGYIGTVFVLGSHRINDIAAFENQICVSHGFQDGAISNQAVSCYDRNGSFNSVSTWIGAPLGATIKAAVATGDEQEGISPTSILMWNPYGLTFDSNGNLYISERDGHKIRMVTKWW